MERLMVNGVELQFNDLSAEVQEKLYLQDKAGFQKEVLKSQHPEIRRILILDKETSSDTLDEIFKVETEDYGNVKNVEELFKHPNFQKSDEKKKILAESDCSELRALIADDEESSSELLNYILLKEFDRKDFDEYVIELVLANGNFEMEEATLNRFAESKNYEYRCIAAKNTKDSRLLNKIFQYELKEYGDEDVINSLVSNIYFKLEERTRKLIQEYGDYELRKKVARDIITTSEELNEFLREEVRNSSDDYVMDAIMENSNFKMELATLDVLVNSEYEEDRIRAVLSKDVSLEFLEDMYSKEREESVAFAIERKITSMLSKDPITLNTVQRRQILKVLKEVKKSKCKRPLSKYLADILDIIG